MHLTAFNRDGLNINIRMSFFVVLFPLFQRAAANHFATTHLECWQRRSVTLRVPGKQQPFL
jgi:hypothetical protein